MSAFYVSAAHKSSGKTTLSIGLAAAFSKRLARVQCFKKGPDYIDPLWLARASGQSCYNLDFNTQGQEEILALFDRCRCGADLSLVEGNKGLFDGMDLHGRDSNAAMANLLGLPVVLVIDVQGITRGIAPLLLGYSQFEPKVSLAGVILNKVGGSRHESKLRQTVEHYTDLPVLGAVQRDVGLQIEERHLGLVPSNEAGAADALVARLAHAVERQVDLDSLLTLHPSRSIVHGFEAMPAAVTANDLVIAVARDAAFGFYYADDLEALQRAGARLVFFSPLADACLPVADGLFIGGGFPETHMEKLAANGAMLTSIRGFIEAGGPCYAECGGLMYLCRQLHWQDRSATMAAVIQADVRMHERPQGRGYVRMQELHDHPWPKSGPDDELPVHEFHYSGLENLAPGYRFGYRLSRGVGILDRQDGLIYKNLLAGYVHQRQVRGNPWAERFLAFVRQCREAAQQPLIR